MKPMILAMFAMFVISGCGGDDSKTSATSNPGATASKSETTAPGNVASTPTNDQQKPKKPTKKPSDEPPGLVLPEDEPDAIGAKGLELPPIR